MPIVPMMTTSRPDGAVSRATAGSTPVTRSMSAWRSPATRTTPGWSDPLTTSGAALPSSTSGKCPRPSRNEM
ncbi:hypothetical protein [Actinomadura madurae]|uniref:hypothetical protein n=1 Tax=Actinomadura madurae TaxID=1993 RepID=UPI0020D1FA1D|nr:hypothetical protein [Actinomadura madurae]MCQ0015444.1 hypothetical protein [Actinomadura madurae]